MKGFFNKDEIGAQEPRPIKNSVSRKAYVTNVLLDPCESCGMYRTCQHPQMGVTGNGRTGILFLAEAQGKTEDELGYQLCGTAGQLFREDVLSPLGLDLDEDFINLTLLGVGLRLGLRIVPPPMKKSLGVIRKLGLRFNNLNHRQLSLWDVCLYSLIYCHIDKMH